MNILTLEVNKDEERLEPFIRTIDDRDKLSGYYQYLDCRCVDMIPIQVEGHSYDVVCDDEALFRNPLVPTLFINEEQVLFGSIGFVKIDEEGNSMSLEGNDVLRLLKYIEGQQDRLSQWVESHQERKTG